ncbi:MAG: DUF4231 domain-containing protein [Candidatus Heimdallarchaeota archaeon]
MKGKGPTITDEEALEFILNPKEEINERIKKALLYCSKQINFYKRQKDSNRIFFHIFQISTIIFSALAPILVLIEQVPFWVKIIPPISVAILVSIMSVFKFKDDWTRTSVVYMKLKMEYRLFALRISDQYKILYRRSCWLEANGRGY